MDTKPIDPAAIRDQVAALPNLADFSKKTGLPLRTLERIKASAKPGAEQYRPSSVALIAINAVLNPPKPRGKKA